jgi:hypothetical protein
MALTQFTNLNFEDIKTSIKDYLRENSNFTDMDFEGSNLSMLINVLAYNSYSTAYNTNMAVNETFIDSATLRENVVSLARNIGYVPRSVRASRAVVDIDITDLPTTTETVSIQPGVIANGSISDVNYIFSIAEKITFPAKDTAAGASIEIYQGQYLENNFTVNNSLPNQRYILPNNGVDTSTLSVKVKNSASDNTIIEYKLANSIVGVTSASNIYLIQETTDEKYEILFGDGVFGKKLESGNVVTIGYIKTNGKAGNGVRFFNFVGTMKDQDGVTESGFAANLFSVTPSENGDSIESLESVKYYAPRLYAAQNRAVTANDYEAILPSLYPNIESVSAYGGEELTPPQYGRVFIAAKPKNGFFLSDLTKKQLLTSLRNYTIAGILPSFVDLSFLYVEVDTYVYFNTNFIGDVDNLKTNVLNSLTLYGGGREINQFGGRFKYSGIQATIDGVDNSITSNITLVRMRRDLVAKINQFAQYEICFLNPFYCSGSSYNIHSTGFNVSGVVGTCYFSDNKLNDKTGDLFLFQILEDDRVQVINSKFGRIDYEKGEVILETVNITSTLAENNIIEIEAVPLSNDVLARNEMYLSFDVAKSNVYMRVDSVATGNNSSGSRFLAQSSYFTDKNVRGTIITTTAGSTLIGYVNGEKYYGDYHVMSDGTKMTGSSHLPGSRLITSSPIVTTTLVSGTSSSSSSSPSSSGY